MKHQLSLSLCLLFVITLFYTESASSQIISQYIETESGTTPKGIEIWNNTAADLNFADNNLVIEKGVNGGTPAEDFRLDTGILTPNSVIVIGTSDMESVALLNGASFYEKAFTFNGDDALQVKYGGTLTDVFGEPGSDPGSSWSGGGVSTANQNIQLKDGITTGELTGFTDPSIRFETVNSAPSGANGLEGFGISPAELSGAGLSASVSSLNGLSYQSEAGPSVSQSFSITGEDLDGTDVVIELPSGSDFEISQSETGTYSNTITLTNYDGSPELTFVRLKSGLPVGFYADQVSISGGGASAIIVDLGGEVSALPYDNVETFVNFPETSGSYQSGNFIGILGNAWDYTDARGDINIDSETVTIRNNSTSSLSSTISDGISVFEFDYQQAFSSDVNLEVYVNGSLVATVTSSSEQNQVKNSGQIVVNQSGSFFIEFKQGSGGGQVSIDNFRWNSLPLPQTYTYSSNTWTPSNPVGVSTSIDNIIIADGSFELTGTLLANNVDVASGAVLNISSTSVLEVYGEIINNGDLTFKSDGDGSGQLVLTPSSSIQGDVTIERFIPAKRAFRLLTSPVGGQSFASSWQQGTHITGLDGDVNGFDNTNLNNSSLFVYDNQISDPTNGAGWQAITSTSDVLQAGKPYRIMVRGDRTIDLNNSTAPATPTTLVSTGTLLTGELTSGVELPALSADEQHFSFVANPFQAVVDFTKVTRNEITDYIYVWDSKIAGNNGRGGFVVVDLSTNVQSPSTSNANKFLIPGQSFFVQNNSVLNDTPELVFPTDAITADENQSEILSNYDDIAYLNVRLFKKQDYENSAIEADAIGFRFSERFSTPPSDEDAEKLLNPGENLAIYNSKILAIDKRSFPETEESIQLLIGNYDQSLYTFDFSFNLFSDDLNLILVDNYLSEEIELIDGSSYSFEVDSSIQESISENRFELKIKPVTLSQDEFIYADDIQLHPNPASDLLSISSSSNINVLDVEIYTMLGQKIDVLSNSANTETQVNVSSLSAGIYLVKINTEKGSLTKRFIKI